MTNRNHTKRCYEAFKSIYGPQHSTPSPLFSADNSKLTSEKEGIMDRWAEHFNKVLNCSSKVNERALARILQTDQNAELDTPLGVEEVTKTINQISSGKAPGSDSIPVEVYKGWTFVGRQTHNSVQNHLEGQSGSLRTERRIIYSSLQTQE